MSVKPIELISMAPKSWETSNQNVARLQKQEYVQQNIVAEHGKDVQHDGQQTVKSAKSDQPEYRYDAKDKGGNKGFSQGGQGKKKEDKEKNEKTDNIRGNKLDILI